VALAGPPEGVERCARFDATKLQRLAYEAPQVPELNIDTTRLGPEAAADAVIDQRRRMGLSE
jgi:hypothetical protein